MVFNPCPFHYTIGGMARFYFTIDSYGKIGYRAVPNVMIAFAMTN
jgi:hypothetical protein